MSNTRKLTTRARNNAVTPDELKITRIKAGNFVKSVYVIDITSDATFRFMYFYYDMNNSVYYCVVPKEMYDVGVRLPVEGSIVNLINPTKFLLDGLSLGGAEQLSVYKIVETNKNYRTAKIILSPLAMAL